MGYFFRPRFPTVDWVNNRQLWEMLSKEMDAKKNKYAFCPHGEKEFAHWRWWGCFIHNPHYKDFIQRLFIVIHDPTCDNDYDGDSIWRRKFNDIHDRGGKKTVKGNGFNKTYSDAYTLPECNEAFNELKQLITTDESVDWETDKEFLANLKQSLKYIMFSKWEDYEAY
jgi:hypothetical protein